MTAWGEQLDLLLDLWLIYNGSVSDFNSQIFINKKDTHTLDY